MAKVKYGALMVDARGKVGGTVFSRSAQGATMRNKVTPVNPRSAAQQAARTMLSVYSAQWRMLLQAQRNAWEQARKNFPRKDQFGDVKILSAQQLFVSLNSNAQKVKATLSAINNPPVPEGASITGSDTITLTLNSSASAPARRIELNVSNVFIGTGNAVELYLRATPALSPGVSNPTGLFSALPMPGGSFVGPATPPSMDVQDGWEKKFGSLSYIGGKVFFEITPINSDTGESGTPVIVSAIVQA